MRTLTRLMLIASLIMATSETVYGQNDWDSLLTVGVSDTLFGISIVQDSLIRIAGVQGVISSNGGSTWATEAALDSMDDVFFVNPDTGFAIGSSGDLRTTTGPSGLTTTAGGSSFTTGTPRVWAFNPDTAIITSQFVEFINITNDGGASTWSNVSPESIMAYNLVFVDSVGWAVGDSGRIWKSTNTGFNWTGQTSGTSQPLLGVSFLDTLRGWAVGDSGTTFFTIDGGTTWNFAGSSVTQALRGVTFVDSLTGWAVGDSGTVVHSADGGITWLQDNSGITSDLWDIGFNSSSIMAVGELGTVLMLNWPPDTILVGDADLDSSVTAVDASLILQHKVRKYTLTGTAFTAADVTGNGTISA